MDAGCGRHGCWYAQQGYKDCHDSSDGRCILAFAASASPPPGGTAAGAVTADRVACGPVTAANVFERGGPWHGAVSGRQFDLQFLPRRRPGRGIVYREHRHPPAGTPHPAREHPDAEEGDIWYAPGPEGPRHWLFYAGAWREVAGLMVEVAWDRPLDGGSEVLRYCDGGVQMRGTWV